MHKEVKKPLKKVKNPARVPEIRDTVPLWNDLL